MFGNDDSSDDEQEPGEILENEEFHTDLEELTYVPKARRQSKRPSNPPIRFSRGTTDMIALMRMGNEDDDDSPVTFSEAFSGRHGKEWKQAMDEEIIELNKKTWKLVPLPTNSKPVKNKWVYTTKRDTDGSVDRRARLVAKGFS